MKIKSTTNYQLPITNYYNAYRTISTTVENPLQIHPFLTNKANFQKSQMNVNSLLTKDYDKMDTWWGGKNKANSKPIQSQFKPNTNPNKPNTNPIRTQTKPISEKNNASVLNN